MSDVSDSWDRAFKMALAMPKSEAMPDATTVNATPKKIGKLGSVLAFPLNEIVGDLTGSRSSPEALAAGVVDVALDAGSLYTPTKPIANPIKWATNTLNTFPRYIIDEDVWKNLGKPYRKKREELKENINAQGNKIIQRLTPPIPYVDY